MLEESKRYVRIWREWELGVKLKGCQPILQWLQKRRVGQKRCHLPLTDYHLWAVFTLLFYFIFLGSRNLYKLNVFWNTQVLKCPNSLPTDLDLNSCLSSIRMEQQSQYPRVAKEWNSLRNEKSIAWCLSHARIWACRRFLYSAFTVIYWNVVI